jgi:hypothetical protein
VDILDLDPGQVLEVRTSQDTYTLVMTNKRERTNNGFVRNIALMPQSCASGKPYDKPRSTETVRIVEVGRPLVIANRRQLRLELGVVTDLFLL